MAAHTTRPAWAFFGITFILSIPFVVLGEVADVQILPGLPLSAAGIVCPATAAVILAIRRNGTRGAATLLARAFDLGRVRQKLWYLPAVLLPPLIMAASFLVMRLSGTAVPTPRISIPASVILFVAFLAGALCEELGWSGWATDPLQERHGALGAALVIGVVWSVWHFIPLLEAHRSWAYIGWWTLGTLSTRVLIVWQYDGSGRSVFMAALLHAMTNLCWQLFPDHGSYYDPRVTGLIAAAVAVLVILAGGKTFRIPRGVRAQNAA